MAPEKPTAEFSRERPPGELETWAALGAPPASCPQPRGSPHGNFLQRAERARGTASASPRPTPAGGFRSARVQRMLPASEPPLAPCTSARCRVVGAHRRPRLGTSPVGARGLLKPGEGARVPTSAASKPQPAAGRSSQPPAFGKRGAHGAYAGEPGIARCRRAPPGAPGHHGGGQAEHRTVLLGISRCRWASHEPGGAMTPHTPTTSRPQPRAPSPAPPRAAHALPSAAHCSRREKPLPSRWQV